MYALYAFSRHTDDLIDNLQPVDVRQRRLEQWRGAVQQALSGQSRDPLLPALVDTIERYKIPHQYMFDVLDGVEMDLQPRHYQTFEQLSQYCYRVASSVGLACVHIWGFRNADFCEPAAQCGLAFQLTNILRDLKEDLAHRRIYLPLEDFERFGYSVDDLRHGVYDRRFTELMRFEIGRAEQLYAAAAPLARFLYSDGRRTFRLMTATYQQLLLEIKHHAGDVLKRRIRLKPRRKLAIALSTMVGAGRQAAGLINRE